MKTKHLILTLIGFLIFCGQYVFGQISEGGIPMSFSLDIDLVKEKVPVIEMAPVNTQALIEEDAKNSMDDIQRPFRFGYAIDVDIDVKKTGMKKELPNGDKLWLLKIHCPGAFSINLIYSYFRLSKGSKFFIYNEERKMILGAFTPEVSNNPDNVFSTDLVQGNTIILEYYEPKSSNDGVIRISKVIHGYINTFSDELGLSAPCNIDVICSPIGDKWRNEQRAITMLLVNENTAFCTGCLVNNTQQDFKPYILTARHCYRYYGVNSIVPSIFRFLYWKPVCGFGSPSNWQSISGATIRAVYDPTDFALLELSSTPPVSWNLFYAGWDRTTTPALNATGIHHPSGDAMKISHDSKSVIAVTFPLLSVPSGALTHWRATFDQGIVQRKSSGSPLFNQKNRILRNTIL